MFYRYSNSDSAICDITGFAMFSDNEGRVSSNYGQNLFMYDGTDAVNIEDLKERITNAWNEYRYNAEDYMQDISADEFYSCFDPDDIVDDAGAWDNSDFRRFFADYIYENESAIILSSGAIVFDEKLIIREV